MYKEFMEQVALKAGKIAEKYFLRVEKEIKTDGSPVTAADKEINRMVIEEVEKTFPTHDVYGEEESSRKYDSDYVWVCDPIDGTIPFTMGVPTSTFSLALVCKGEPIAAVVYHFNMKHLYYAEKGTGCFLNEEKICINTEAPSIGFTHWKYDAYDVGNTFKVLTNEFRFCMDYGSVCLMGALVAKGELGGIIFPHTTAHDVAAIKLLIEEAGGICSDIYGNTQKYDNTIKGFIGCCSKQRHKRTLKIIKETMKERLS